MRICNVALAWNQWSVFRNLDENHAFFHSFVRGHWAYGKHAILELECAFYLTFGTFLDVCIRFFFTFAVSSCVKPAGTIVQDQEIKKNSCVASTMCTSVLTQDSCVASTMCTSVLTQDSCVASTMCTSVQTLPRVDVKGCMSSGNIGTDAQVQGCHYTPPHPPTPTPRVT